MVILDAIASVNKTNQYYNEHHHHHHPHQHPSSSYKNSAPGPEKRSPSAMNRHYPGKAVDVSLSLEPSNAMGALYEANWVNAHQAMMKKPLSVSPSPVVGGSKYNTSPPMATQQQHSPRKPHQPQPECHSPPHLRNKPQRGERGKDHSAYQQTLENSDRDSSSGSQKSSNVSAGNSKLSSLGKYQVTLDQIRRLEEKDASITKTICELNGFKPTTLRRRPRQLYPEWDEQSRNRKRNDDEEDGKPSKEQPEVKKSDLVSHFLKLKSNKKFADEKNNLWDRREMEVEKVTGRENYPRNKGRGSPPTEKSDILKRDHSEDQHQNVSNLDLMPLRNSLRFCGGSLDIKDIFRRKKDAQELNNKVSANGGRKIYPKTINLTKNLVRDPVVLDPGSQPTFLAEKHRHHHNRSQPNLSRYDDDDEDRARVAEAHRNMKYNQRNCDSSTPTSSGQRSFEDHDYEVIEYQDVQLRENPQQQVKRSNTTVSRAKSVRINPVADTIQDEMKPRNGIAKWKHDRASMPIDKFNTITTHGLSRSPVSSSTSSPSPPMTSPTGGKSSAIRRTKSINPNSFLDNWSRRRTVREESEYENAIVLPPPPPSRSPPAPPGRSSLRAQASMRQRQPVVEIKQKLVQSVAPHQQQNEMIESMTNRSEVNSNSDDQDQFVIPRPRLIVPVHTYARKRRTGNLRADVGAEEESGAKDDEGKINCGSVRQGRVDSIV